MPTSSALRVIATAGLVAAKAVRVKAGKSEATADQPPALGGPCPALSRSPAVTVLSKSNAVGHGCGKRSSGPKNGGLFDSPKRKRAAKAHFCLLYGGSGEIRTHGGVTPTAVFKTAALNRSATLPDAANCIGGGRPARRSAWRGSVSRPVATAARAGRRRRTPAAPRAARRCSRGASS